MAFDFPASPTEGQVYSPAGGPSYQYTGGRWMALGGNMDLKVSKSGDTMSGTLEIANSAPVLRLTDTDTGAQAVFSGQSSAGSAAISVDVNDVIAGSLLYFRVDGLDMVTISATSMISYGALRVGTTGNEFVVSVGGSLIITNPNPQIQLTDSDTGADNFISGSSSVGALQIQADQNNEVANSSINFFVDGTNHAYLSSTGQMQILNNGIVANGASTVDVAAPGAVAVLTCNDATATTGPSLYLDRNSASPAISDFAGLIAWRAKNSAAVMTTFAQLFCQLTVVTNGTETSIISLQNTSAGTLAGRVTVGSGLYMAGASGSDKGPGTINATDVYDNNVLLTCMALTERFRTTGKFDAADLAEWDAKVPPTIIPEERRWEEVMEDVEEIKIFKNEDGKYQRQKTMVSRRKVTLQPLYDEDGETVVGQVEEPVMREVVIPEQVIPRQHHAAHVFKEMIDSGFDPRDPKAYITKMRTDGAVPGMPLPDEWIDNELSTGKMISRLWLALDMLVLTLEGMVDGA